MRVSYWLVCSLRRPVGVFKNAGAPPYLVMCQPLHLLLLPGLEKLEQERKCGEPVMGEACDFQPFKPRGAPSRHIIGF